VSAFHPLRTFRLCDRALRTNGKNGWLADAQRPQLALHIRFPYAVIVDRHTIMLVALALVGCGPARQVEKAETTCVAPDEHASTPLVSAADRFLQHGRDLRSCARRVAYQFGRADIPIDSVIQSAVDQCEQHVRYSLTEVPSMGGGEAERAQIERELDRDLEATARFHILEVRSGTCPDPGEHRPAGPPG